MRISRGLPAAADGATAFTIGNFDGVHLGHEAMLDELARAARRLSDETLTAVKASQATESLP